MSAIFKLLMHDYETALCISQIAPIDKSRATVLVYHHCFVLQIT